MGRPRTPENNTLRDKIIVDEEDKYLLEDYLAPLLVRQGSSYSPWRVWIKGLGDYLHRIVLTAKKGEEVDHINGNPLDNRRANLRIVTSCENSWNSRAHADSKYSKYKGVSLWRFKHHTRKKPWVCQIMASGKKRKSYFSTEREAAEQYNLWALELHGNFALLNNLED